MSVLDTFYILFETNAKEVKAGTDDARKSGKSLADDMGKLDSQTKNVGASFGAMIGKAAGALAGIFAVSALAGNTMRALSDTQGLQLQAQAINANIGTLDALGRAMEKQGGSADGFRSALVGINADMQQLATTGQSSLLPILGRLGISMLDASGNARDVMDVLPEIADALSGMRPDQALSLGRSLGFDDATVRTIMRGRAAVAELTEEQRRLGVRTEADAALAREFAASMVDLRQMMMQAAMGIAAIVVPAFKAVHGAISAVTDHISANRGFYDLFFAMLATAAASVAAVVLFTYVPAMWAAAAATAAAIWPVTLLIAIIGALSAAIALVYDDWMTFKSGGVSAIGAVVDSFKAMIDWANKAWDSVRSFFGFGPSETAIDAVRTARHEIQVAANSPIAATSSAAIMAGNSSRSTSISVGAVSVNTQATDAEGISAAIGKTLQDQLASAADQFDDGVQA